MKANFIKVEDINRFVNFVSKLNGKVYLKSEEFKVNAKSIIGVMYLVNEHPNNVIVEVEDALEEKLPMALIIDGKINHYNLRISDIRESELIKRVKDNGIKEIKEVFFSFIDEKGNLYIQRKM